MNKEKMIDMLEKAKSIVADVWTETGIGEVGDVLSDIYEAIDAIEEFEGEKQG